MFGWKLNESKITPDLDRKLIRFFNQAPTFLDTPENEVLFRERAEKAFGPRPVDQGKPSYWEVASDMQQNRISAQNAIRRDKPEKFNFLRIDLALIRSHNFSVIEERDDDAFDCVADFHRMIDMRPENTLEEFIEVLRRQLLETDHSTNDNNKAVAYESLNKTAVKRKLKDVAAGCQNLDLSGVHDWVKQAINER